eukprot:GDKI01037264.1.p3 GENE.GDKI01037264.1~~GDKI01037264.1.p3  ORF type:complete len:109 (-),score=30.34 GDKI01037264.1:257-583(-)
MIVWNSHRIYGLTRFPQLISGWNIVDVFCIKYAHMLPDKASTMQIARAMQQRMNNASFELPPWQVAHNNTEMYGRLVAEEYYNVDEIIANIATSDIQPLWVLHPAALD